MDEEREELGSKSNRSRTFDVTRTNGDNDELGRMLNIN